MCSSACSSRGRYSFLLCLLLAGQTPLVRCQVLEPSHKELQVEGCEEEEKAFDSEVRVATVQFSELQIEFLIVCFVLLVVLAKTGEGKVALTCISISEHHVSWCKLHDQ